MSESVDRLSLLREDEWQTIINNSDRCPSCGHLYLIHVGGPDFCCDVDGCNCVGANVRLALPDDAEG